MEIVAIFFKIQAAEEFFVFYCVWSLCLKAISSQYTNETAAGIIVAAVFKLFSK